MNIPFDFLPGASVAWLFVSWILTAIVHIGFAIAVLNDTVILWNHFRRKTFLVGGVLWALATLLGGVFVAAIYWLIHHSTLRPQQAASASQEKPASSRAPNEAPNN